MSPADWAVVRHSTVVQASTVLVSRGIGSRHLDIQLVTLDAGSDVSARVHPFEQSFFVLGGEGTVTIGSATYLVEEGDFALVPIGTPYRWSAIRGMELLQVRAPQPAPHVASDHLVDLAEHPAIPPRRDTAAPHRPVGRFRPEHLPPPGPLSMKGYRGPQVSGVSVWMLIDELVGALHHTMFVVQFAPGAQRQSAGDHYHPFEEAYYFVAGSAIAHLEGQDIEVGRGDLVFCGVNALHGYTVLGDEPVRWIEVQAPVPPPSGATVFPQDWAEDADGLRS